MDGEMSEQGEDADVADTRSNFMDQATMMCNETPTRDAERYINARRGATRQQMRPQRGAISVIGDRRDPSSSSDDYDEKGTRTVVQNARDANGQQGSGTPSHGRKVRVNKNAKCCNWQQTGHIAAETERSPPAGRSRTKIDEDISEEKLQRLIKEQGVRHLHCPQVQSLSRPDRDHHTSLLRRRDVATPVETSRRHRGDIETSRRHRNIAKAAEISRRHRDTAETSRYRGDIKISRRHRDIAETYGHRERHRASRLQRRAGDIATVADTLLWRLERYAGSGEGIATSAKNRRYRGYSGYVAAEVKTSRLR